jgi:hypothetical protein
MALSYVNLTLDVYDAQGNPLTKGTASFAPSAQLTDTTDHELITQLPIVVTFRRDGTLPVVKLLATDNAGALPSGWGWTVTFAGMASPAAAFSFFLPFSGGSSQFLSAQAPVSSVVTMAAYLPLPSGGPPSAGEVPSAIGDGSQNSVWAAGGGGGGGGSPTGAAGGDLGGTYPSPQVRATHLTSPLPVAQGGTAAVTAGAALTSLGAAPIASPALTGTPTAPTATALTSSTQLATTAYADAATGVEKTRALAAEALLAPLASPALTGTPTAPTKTALTSNTDIATTAYADSAVSVEKTRALAAEALALPQSGGTMTGWLAPAVATLSFVGSGTTLVNAALGNVFALTLTASTTTLGNPSNPVDGQAIRVRLIQDATGSRTIAFGTAYDFGTAGAPTLSTGASKVDILGFEYVASLSKWCYLGSGLGF